MKLLKFKTNIEGEEEIGRVSGFLNNEGAISRWAVDPGSEGNILSVSGENPNPQAIEDAVRKAGFEIEVLRVLGTGGEGL
ncbi:hypothetical protein [Rufibacter tibetensis]|uniref:Copper chaperone n=1 Tax=Rufibacter tibetensis TaxID=512763 RepID=A0A0N7HX43_9BACT|nr:hypothetical protein [Rufibacter tibetensis]ALJ01009.1 hypothetical protein DC20_20960 [Rufibacter tibetensis]